MPHGRGIEMWYDTGLGLGRLSMCHLLPCVDGSRCGKRYLLRIHQNAGTVLGPLRIVWRTTAARVVRVIYPEPSRLRGRLLVRIRHFAEVQLRILEGYSLQGVDEAILYGKASSDPYCVVEYRGKKVLKTKYRSKTLDPKWYEQITLEIEIPSKGAVGADGEAPTLAGAPGALGASRTRTCESR